MIGDGRSVRYGHKKAVTCLAVSSDLQYIVTGCNDKKVRVWMLEVGFAALC